MLCLLVVVTYDGAGGASAGDTVAHYQQGVAVADTATNSGTYVSMENLASPFRVGSLLNPPVAPFPGQMAGGPLGPFYTQIELSAANVLALYNIGNGALTGVVSAPTRLDLQFEPPHMGETQGCRTDRPGRRI